MLEVCFGQTGGEAAGKGLLELTQRFRRQLLSPDLDEKVALLGVSGPHPCALRAPSARADTHRDTSPGRPPPSAVVSTTPARPELVSAAAAPCVPPVRASSGNPSVSRLS